MCFKELAHVTVEAPKFEISSANQQAGNSGRISMRNLVVCL